MRGAAGAGCKQRQDRAHFWQPRCREAPCMRCVRRACGCAHFCVQPRRKQAQGQEQAQSGSSGSQVRRERSSKKRCRGRGAAEDLTEKGHLHLGPVEPHGWVGVYGNGHEGCPSLPQSLSLEPTVAPHSLGAKPDHWLSTLQTWGKGGTSDLRLPPPPSTFPA